MFADNAVDGLMDLVQFIFSSISPAISTVKSAKAVAPSPSLWRALWNDIFSKVRYSGKVGFGVLFLETISHLVTQCNHWCKTGSCDGLLVLVLF